MPGRGRQRTEYGNSQFEHDATAQHRKKRGQRAHREPFYPAREETACAIEQRHHDEERTQGDEDTECNLGRYQQTDRTQHEQHRTEPHHPFGRKCGEVLVTPACFLNGDEHHIDLLGEHIGGRATGSGKKACEIVRRQHRKVPDHALVRNPAGCEGQHKAERHHAGD